MATILKWLIKSVIAPILFDWAIIIYKKYKKNKELIKESDESIKAADEYERSPSTDNLNNLP